MVCGVTVLTSLLEKTGGIDLFTTLLARLATRRTITGWIALVTGLVSVYSSTAGVVLPAFLPSVAVSCSTSSKSSRIWNTSPMSFANASS